MLPVQQIDPTEAARLQQEGATLVDVRTDPEVARGVIEGAVHVPLHLLPERHGELPAGRPLVIYCQSGGRSAQACGWLSANGHDPVYNLQGGVMAWMRDGRPLVAPG